MNEVLRLSVRTHRSHVTEGGRDLLGVEQLQGGDGGQWGPVVQQGVDLCHAAPVPAGRTGQDLGQAALEGTAVVSGVPQELPVRPRQPGQRHSG